jgi:TnpA family transposase
VLRLVGSIKAGHVAPSVMLRKLAAYERQNQLDVALQEIGKVERTLFMLDWLENPSCAGVARPVSTTASSAMP